MEGAVQLSDIVWTGLVTLLSALQMARFARRVGNSRQKFKIEPPSVEGDPEFIRTFRAQQNSLEFYPLFILTLWMASLFFHQIPAAIAGLYYCYSRHQYFDGYIEEAKKRRRPFINSVKGLQALLGLGGLGIVHCLMVTYLGINLMTFFFPSA